MNKYLLSLVILCTMTLSIKAQDLTQAENYVYSKTYLEPITASSNTAKQIQEVAYIDGLGRSKQKVSIKITPSGKDIVTPVEYDVYGRPLKSMLPLPQQGTQNGEIYNSPDMAGAASVYGNVSNYYSEKKIENSPLDRIQELASPGDAWKMGSGKTVKYTYESNIDSEVRKFMVTTSWSNVNTISVAIPALSISTENTEYASGGYYKKGTLYKNTVIDEDGNTVTTFINTKDQAILIRRNDGIQNVDTYYVYDEYGQKAFVIPPLAVQKIADAGNTITTTILDALCYQYRYDNEGREVEKKLPGKDFEFMLYDLQDRLVGTQDANLRKQGQWIYTKYDQFGRAAITGISTGGSRMTEQSLVNLQGLNNVARTQTIIFTQQGMAVYYDNPENTYPKSSARVALLSVNYYDTYPLGAPAIPETILGQSTLTSDPVLMSVNNTRTIRSTNGLTTASYVKNIEDDNWTKNYFYYDNKGRKVGERSWNHLGGYTKTESKLDFTGNPEESYTYHLRNAGSTEIKIKERLIYDGQNRLLKHYHQVDTQPEELLAENIYNDIGQLINKKTGNTTGTPLQSIDYKYNIRGWLTKLNDPANLNGKLFAYELKYENPVNGSLAKYSGNIAEFDWRSATGNFLRRYAYKYDKLNRLLDASYGEPFATIPLNDRYSEKVTYDLNGNIQTLKRYQPLASTRILIDNLNYQVYDGNRLKKVTDDSANPSGYPTGGNIIDYDANGNMINHLDKGISAISYNFLNLPTEVKLADKDRLNFLYRADGMKLKYTYSYYIPQIKTVMTKNTEYLNGFQYVQEEGGTPLLQFFPTSEGYYDFQKKRYIYNYQDHLGNIRLAYYRGSNNEVVTDRETGYYPFGMEYIAPNISQLQSYTYGFQEQERQKETGWSSFKWRNSIPELGRFFNVDPLSEKYAYQSHYNFSENRVVDARELEGLERISIHTANYAPFDSFGGPLPALTYYGNHWGFRVHGPFAGDGADRKPGTNPNASSKIYGRVDLDLGANSAKDALVNVVARGSHSKDLSSGETTLSEASLTVSLVKDKNQVNLDMHLSGNNDLVFLSPDIDVKPSMTITTTSLSNGNKMVHIRGIVSGDHFPANETYITGQNGQGVTLGNSGPLGGEIKGPTTSLPGDNNRIMSQFNKIIYLDKDNNITQPPKNW